MLNLPVLIIDKIYPTEICMGKYNMYSKGEFDIVFVVRERINNGDFLLPHCIDRVNPSQNHYPCNDTSS